MKVCRHRDGRGRYGCIFTPSRQNDGVVSKDQLTIGSGINEDTDAPFYLRPKEKIATRGHCCRSLRPCTLLHTFIRWQSCIPQRQLHANDKFTLRTEVEIIVVEVGRNEHFRRQHVHVARERKASCRSIGNITRQKLIDIFKCVASTTGGRKAKRPKEESKTESLFSLLASDGCT